MQNCVIFSGLDCRFLQLSGGDFFVFLFAFYSGACFAAGWKPHVFTIYIIYLSNGYNIV